MLYIFYNNNNNKKNRSVQIQPTSAEYHADVHDRFALCKLKQTFMILSTEDIAEATYQFPVDYNSAFYELIVTTPREKIIGIVKEKNEARNIYETAKKEGRQAFLTEESATDRDIYKLSMGNLLQGDQIVVEYEAWNNS